MNELPGQVLESQFADVRAAFGLALALNRTLILPHFHCSDRVMAFPCYAWYHRARFVFGWALDKVPSRLVAQLLHRMHRCEHDDRLMTT